VAYLNAAAILARVEQVIVDSLGNLRTVPSSRFQADAYTGQPDAEAAVRAFVKPTVEAEIVAQRPHPRSPPAMHSMQLREIDVTVTVTRATDATAKIDAATRRAIKALSASDADVIAQALGYPGGGGNLATTSAGTLTGLVSGILAYVDSATRVEFGGETSARVVSVHRFRGVVNITQATS
jgi:hypothetical protein